MLYGLHTGSPESDRLGFSLIAAGRTGTDFSFWLRSLSGSGVCRRMERVKLPWVTVSGTDEVGGLGSGSGGLETVAGGEIGKVGRGEGGGENRRVRWGSGGRLRERGAILAAMAGPAVEDRWPSRRWLNRTSTPGVERRKVAASWAQDE